MKIHGLATAAVGLALASQIAYADPVPLDPEDNITLGQTFTHLGTNSYRFDWLGAEGTAYFTQWSTDLEEFHYLPEIDLGLNHDPIDFTPLDDEGNPYPRLFVRLQIFETATLDPKNADFDADGISNWLELTVYGTDPLKADTDSDGLPDGQEDTDGDGLPDAFERLIIANSPDPDSLTLVDITAIGDNDSDGLSNWIEYQRGLSGYRIDSDGDGYGDRLTVDQLLFLRLDESTGTTANDDSGGNHHGTLGASPTWLPVGGVAGGGLTFDGGGDTVTLPSETLDGADALTISLWFKMTATPAVHTLLSGAGASQSPELAIDIETGDTIRFTTGGGNSVTWDAGRTLADGLWHHVVLVRDPLDGQVSLHLDGVPFGTPQTVSLATLDISSLVLGQRHMTVSTYDSAKAFNGTLDEVRIWSAVIETKNLAELFQPNDLDFDGLPDDYEISLFGNLSTLAASGDDLDGDSRSNRQEYDEGTDPNDYYNGSSPVVSLFSGSGQTIYNGQRTAAPLVFLVTDGTAPLVNAPVELSHLELIGGIETLDGNTIATTLTLRTDSEGKVRVHFKAD
jgi:hypothetical protein